MAVRVVGRLRVAGVRIERAPGRVAATVTLDYGGGTVTGRAERASGDSQAVAAEAALDAVRQVAPPHTRWALEQVVVQPLLAGRAVIASVLLETEGAAEHLIGSALSRAGPLEDAAADAVVNAVERRLGWFIAG